MTNKTEVKKYQPDPSKTFISLNFKDLENNGFVVELGLNELILRTDMNGACNEKWYEATSALASAGGYEDSLSRNLLFDAIDQAEMRIRLIKAISGEGV